MCNQIVKHWHGAERELPGIDCIVLPDGQVIILNCYGLYDPNTNARQLFCQPLCDTTIESIEKYQAAYWTRVDAWTGIDYQGGTIYGGDGAMGNEGFIACVDAGDNLLWGMFFLHTNPIKSLEINQRTLIAINEHAELQIEIDLDVLTNIKIIVLPTDNHAK